MSVMAKWLRWHRRLGLTVALLVTVLVITGILLNHSPSLGLNRAPVYSAWLGKLYGIPSFEIETGFPVQSGWVVQAGERIYLDQQTLLENGGQLHAALLNDGELWVLCNNGLWLFDIENQSELIEQIRDVPAGMQRAGLFKGQLVVETGPGLSQSVSKNLLQFDLNSTSWQPIPQTELTEDVWLTPQTIPPQLTDSLKSRTPLPGLTLERVLLDLHSGRLFGDIGVWVVDLVGIALLILAGSGFYTWFGRYRKRR